MEKETVHLFIFDTLADWEPGFAIAGINNPAFQAQPGRYQVKSVAVNKEPVKTIGGVTILPDMTLDELEPTESAMLILPGGEIWDQGGNGEVVKKAQAFLEANVPVAAICGATAGLARAGLLDNKAHTSNAPMYLQATGYRGEALYRMETAVTDQNLITASVIAPVDFAYHIFKKLGVYAPDTLEAWRGLYKTGDPSYFAALMESVAKSDAN